VAKSSILLTNNYRVIVKVKTRTGAVFPFSPGGYTNNQNNLENMDETKKASWEKGQKKPPGME